MNIIILGPQGSGKGTQARILSERLGLYHFEMGGFLRELAKTDSKIEKTLKNGELIPDEMFFFAMKDLLQEKISSGKGVILDGFPRTTKQYEMLKNWFDQEGLNIDKTIFLDISDKEVIRRLSARRTCDKCGEVYNLITSPKPKNPEVCDKCGGKLIQRKDDNPDSIRKRLEVYRENTVPLLNIFEKEGLLLKVEGERPIEVISEDLLALLQK